MALSKINKGKLKNKPSSLLIILLSISYIIQAQETKFVLNKNKDFTEEYYILKGSEKIKHGTYVKYKYPPRGIQLLVSGNYINGFKDGVWISYYALSTKYGQNSVKEKGNYVNDKKNGIWTYYYMDTIPDIVDEEKFGNKRKTDSIGLTINHQSAKLKTVGMFLNNKKVGDWTSFNSKGEVSQKYNFTKHLLIFDNSIKDSLTYNTSQEAIFIGGTSSLDNYLVEQFNFNVLEAEVNAKNDSIYVAVAFKIDKDGKASDIKIDSKNAHGALEKEAIRIISLTTDNWIPAKSNGEIIDSVYRILVYCKREKPSAGHTKFKMKFMAIR